MYKFELISQASEFARDRLNDRHGFDESRNENITFVQDTFKQYVQLLTRLEDWDKPWQQAVDTHLRGKGLTFPLTVTELEKAVFDFTVNPSSINAEQYHSIGLYTFVLRTKLENRLAEHLKKRNQIDRGALAHAASASLHYVHSPISAVRFAAERVPLIDGFDWPTEIIRASNNRAEFFLP